MDALHIDMGSLLVLLHPFRVRLLPGAPGGPLPPRYRGPIRLPRRHFRPLLRGLPRLPLPPHGLRPQAHRSSVNPKLDRSLWSLSLSHIHIIMMTLLWSNYWLILFVIPVTWSLVSLLICWVVFLGMLSSRYICEGWSRQILRIYITIKINT